MTDVAGIGEFVDPPVPNTVGDFPLKIRVSEYWTADPGTNIITITMSQRVYSDGRFVYKRTPFPEHVPIVFFAVKKAPASGQKAIENGKGNDVSDISNLVFHRRNTTWFEKDRDNGLVYEYATNLWDCIRVNPNKEKYYETIINGITLPYGKSRWIHEVTSNWH